jgi:hypothetical protein
VVEGGNFGVRLPMRKGMIVTDEGQGSHHFSLNIVPFLALVLFQDEDAGRDDMMILCV